MCRGSSSLVGSLVGTEVISVPAGALSEMDLFKRGRRCLDGLDEVEEHVLVCRDRLAGIHPLRDGQIEQMRDVRDRSELGLAVGRIEKVHGDVSVVAGNPRFAALP